VEEPDSIRRSSTIHLEHESHGKEKEVNLQSRQKPQSPPSDPKNLQSNLLEQDDGQVSATVGGWETGYGSYSVGGGFND